MGRYINPDLPMTDEDKQFLRSRARNDEVIENERRFPPGGEPDEHEEEGFMPSKPGYDYKAQAEKTEDVTGLPITPLPTDDKGHPIVPEYGYPDDDDDEDVGEIDDDIIAGALDKTVPELRKALKDLDQDTSGNKDDLVDRLANVLQDKRDAENKK